MGCLGYARGISASLVRLEICRGEGSWFVMAEPRILGNF